MQNDKSPGNDLIVGYWYKHLTFYRHALIHLFDQTFNGQQQLPAWLTKARTWLIPKSEDTNIAKNYRPIACQNLMFKLYTGCINTFLQHHCEINNIITSEQGGGKRNVWGCVEQLLINKTVLNEVRSNRRNLITIWLDYQKAFDFVLHSWMIECLRLAKVPNLTINAIESKTRAWTTNVCINGANDSYVSNIITYLKGIFQGDILSVLLFIFSLNPMSFLLNKLKGYMPLEKMEIETKT